MTSNCSFNKCTKKAKKLFGIGNNFELGSIPLCEDCLTKLEHHNKAREIMAIKGQIKHKEGTK